MTIRLKNWARSSHDGQTAETWAQVWKLCLVSCLKKMGSLNLYIGEKMSNLLARKKGLQTCLRCCCCCCSFLFRSETLRSWKLSMKANQSLEVIISRKKLFCFLLKISFFFVVQDQKTKNKNKKQKNNQAVTSVGRVIGSLARFPTFSSSSNAETVFLGQC